jgi:hypothetical protein
MDAFAVSWMIGSFLTDVLFLEADHARDSASPFGGTT